MRFVLLCVLIFLSTAVTAQIEIEKPWSRATAPGAKLAAGYMMISNNSAAPDRLIDASSPLAGRVETHVTVKDGEILRMRQVKGYPIPARGSFELKPGGAHLMFVNLRSPFKQGEKIPVTLRFERAGEVKTEFHVGRLGGGPPHSKH